MQAMHGFDWHNMTVTCRHHLSMHRLLTVLRFLCLGFIALLGATSSWAGTCFAFDDTTGSLVVFDQQAPLVVRKSIPIPGGFGGELVEAAYFDGVNNRYYLVRQGSPNTLGYIDPLTDTYIAISPGGGLGTAVTPAAISVGTGNGGTRITGLSYNPISGNGTPCGLTAICLKSTRSPGSMCPERLQAAIICAPEIQPEHC